MVYCLLGIDDEDIDSFCPFCKEQTDLEVDDYVKGNMLMWCTKHGEILICPEGQNGISDMDNLIEGQTCFCNCATLISRVNTEEMGYALEKEYNYIWKVGVLRISNIFSTAGSEVNSPRLDTIKYNRVNALCFKEIPKEIDTSHDGMNLYYKGTCTECNKNFENYIWGD